MAKTVKKPISEIDHIVFRSPVEIGLAAVRECFPRRDGLSAERTADGFLVEGKPVHMSNVSEFTVDKPAGPRS